MPLFIDRYRRGEHQQVWDELVRLGEDVRDEATFADARAVAHETMRRAKENVTRLITRLQEIRYRFAYQSDPAKRIGSWCGDSFPVYEPPHPDAARLLAQAERTLGPMPLSLRAWYEVVGTVNLIGHREGWPNTATIDPLFVYPLADMCAHIEELYEGWRDYEVPTSRDPAPFRWEIGPDDLHKGNFSGSGPYGVEYPCPAADARLWFEWHDTTFVNYLRICLRWGGFPGFERLDPSERPSDDLAMLTADLLPL